MDVGKPLVRRGVDIVGELDLGAADLRRHEFCYIFFHEVRFAESQDAWDCPVGTLYLSKTVQGACI